MTLPLSRKCEDLAKQPTAKSTFVSTSPDPKLLKSLQISQTRNSEDANCDKKRMIQTQTPTVDDRFNNEVLTKSYGSSSSQKIIKPGTIQRIKAQPQSQLNYYYKTQKNNLSGKIKKNCLGAGFTKDNVVITSIEEENDPLNQLSSFEQNSEQLKNHLQQTTDPVVNGLHEGIQFLQKNLQQLESKYKGLTCYYNNERLIEKIQFKYKLRKENTELEQKLIQAQKDQSELKSQFEKETQELVQSQGLLVQEAQQKLSQVQDALDLVNKEKERLSEEVDLLKVKNASIQSDSNKSIGALQSQVDKLQQKLSNKENNLQSLQTNLQALQTTLKENEIQSKSELKKAKEQISHQASSFTAQIKDLEYQFTTQIAELKSSHQQEILQKTQENEQLQSQNADVLKQLTRENIAKEMIEKKHKKIEMELKLTIENLKTQIIAQFPTQSPERKNERLSTELQKVKELTKTNEELQNQISNLQTILSDQSREHNAALQEKTEIIENLQEQLNNNNKDNQIEQLQQQVEDLENQEQERIQTLEQNLSLIQKLKKQLQNALEKNKEYKDQLTELKQLKDDLQSQSDVLCAFVLESNQEHAQLQSEITSLKTLKQTQLSNLQSLRSVELKTIQTKLKAFKQEMIELKKEHNNQKLLEDQAYQELMQHFTKQCERLLDKKQQELEDSIGKQTSSSQQVQQYKKKMQEHFFEQESLIQKLQEDTLNTKTKLEQDLADANLKLELRQVEHDAVLENLKQQISKLGEASEIDGLREQVKDLSEELMAKNELIEEANNFIIEYQDEKHELKAKFKFLIGIIQDDQTVSSYKSSDEIDIDKCFEILENEIMQKSQNSKMILQDLVVTQTKEEANDELNKRQELTDLRDQQVKELKEIVEQMEIKMNYNGNLAKKKLEQAQNKINKLLNAFQDQNQAFQELQYVNLNLQTELTNLQQQKQEPIQQLNDSERSIDDARDNSLIAENAQLLQRLQKCETLLQQARDASKSKAITLNQIDLVQLEEKLDIMRKQFITCFQDITKSLQEKLAAEILLIKQNYLNDCIFKHNIASNQIVESWNDQVEIIAQIMIKSEIFYIILAKDQQIYFLQGSSLSDSALMFIRSFVNDVEGEIVNVTDEDFKILKDLVKDLSTDLLELRQEYFQYVADLKLEQVERNEVALMDEVEYLTGENRELHLKVKQLCLVNAALKLQNFQSVQQAQEDEKAARNLGDVLSDKEQSDFISEHDSFKIVVENMSPINNESSLKKQLSKANQQKLDLQDQINQNQSKIIEAGEPLQDVSVISETTTLAHVKGTLIQFLKTTPFTEKQNEELLKIIYSMLMFTSSEIVELQNSRSLLKGSAGKGHLNVQAQNSNSKSQNTEESCENTDKKVKKGILGLFNRAVKNTTSGEKSRENQIWAPQPQPSPIKR